MRFTPKHTEMNNVIFTCVGCGRMADQMCCDQHLCVVCLDRHERITHPTYHDLKGLLRIFTNPILWFVVVVVAVWVAHYWRLI